MLVLKNLPFLFFLCLSSILYAQINLDSLNALLPNSKGTHKVDLLNTIAWELKFSDPDRAIELCKESNDLAKKTEYLTGEAKALYCHGVLLQLRGAYDKSFAVSEQAIIAYKKLNDSSGLARIWNMRAIGFEQTGKYPDAIDSYNNALAIAQMLEDKGLTLAVKGNIANVLSRKGEYLKAIEKYEEVSVEYLERGDSSNYYLSLGNLGSCFYRVGNYTKALPIFFENANFEKSKNQKYQLADSYNDIGLLYAKLELFDESFNMFKKALLLYKEMGNKRRIGSTYLHIGNHYGKIKELEKADSFFLKTLHIYDSLGVESTGAIYNNLAENKMQRKEFGEAISLLNKSLEINKSNGTQNFIALNYTNLGTTYLELGQLKESEKYFLMAMTVWSKSGNNFEIQIAASSLAQIFKQRNNQKDFEYYSAIAQAANDSLFNKEKLLSINRTLVQNLKLEHDNKSKKLQAELELANNKLVVSENNSKLFFQKYAYPLLFISLLLLMGILWFFKKNKQTTILNKTLKNKAIADQERFETSLESKNKQLTLLSLETAQQTDLFKKIQDSLQQIITKNPENLEIKKLETILTSHSLDQHNWENFTSYFNEVYVGFFDRIFTSFPAITNKELRLCALIRLKIPSFEASTILGISQRSVHKSRYRIRKKMELDTEANLDEFICSI